MIPHAIVGAAIFGGMGALGFIENSTTLMGVGTTGLLGLQVWTLMMLQPIRDQLAKLRTENAVARERIHNLEMHVGMRRPLAQDENTPG